MSDEQDNQVDWKSKFNELLDVCGTEIKKTTEIGKKMLSASQSNANLRETYEELGQVIKQRIESDQIKIEDSDVIRLVEKAAKLESQMESFESDVHDIKKG